MSNSKQPALTLGSHVSFYITGTKDLIFRKQFRMRPSYRFPLGPYLGIVADIDVSGTSVSLQVLDAVGQAYARSGVRVLNRGESIPEHAEFDVCVVGMENAQILRDPESLWTKSEVVA